MTYYGKYYFYYNNAEHMISCVLIWGDEGGKGERVIFFTVVLDVAGKAMVVLVSPLLFESGKYVKWLKKTIVVYW